MSFPVLPYSLALLLHLHLLSYPRCASPEYSTVALFSPNRPLRDRTRTMEDIVAFLIEVIEGHHQAKAVLNDAYPCLQNSDSILFRIYVSKYIENLRNIVIRPNSLARVASSSSSSGSTRQQQSGAHNPPGRPSAWWWSEVVVRKSLFEGCSGIKFERLLLALSTHALFSKLPPTSPLHPDHRQILDLAEILRKQPERYSSLLFNTIESHASRIQRATRLNRRAASLIALRSRLALVHKTKDSSYAEAAKLSKVRDSIREVVIRTWELEIGRTDVRSITAEQALELFLSLIADMSKSNGVDDKLKVNFEGADITENNKWKNTAQTIPTLPIAAAHHANNLRKLVTFPPLVFLHDFGSAEIVHGEQSQEFSSATLQEWSNTNIEQRHLLEEILSQAKRQCEFLSSKIASHLENQMSSTSNRPSFQPWVLPAFILSPKTELVDDKVAGSYEKDMNVPNVFLDENESQLQERFERDVLKFRESLHPKFPIPGAQSTEFHHDSTSEDVRTAPASSHPIPLHRTLAAFITPETAFKAESKVTMFMTPRSTRRSTLLPSMIASGGCQNLESLADLSLPYLNLETLSDINLRSARNDEDATWEGNSMTVRDILILAGGGHESFETVDQCSEDDEELPQVAEW